MPRKRYLDTRHTHLEIGPVKFVPCYDDLTEKWGSAFETADPKVQELIEKSLAFNGLTVTDVVGQDAGVPSRGELGHMNKTKLQALLVELGALVPAHATKAQLVELIAEFKPPEQAGEAGKEE